MRRTRSVRRMGVSALAALVLLLVSTAADANPLQVGYTIDSTLAFSAGSASGFIDPVDPLFVNTGLNGFDAICLGGVCDVFAQEWLVFEVRVTGGSVNDVGVAALFTGALGFGYFLQGGPAQDGTGATDTYTGNFGNPNLPTYTFLANGGGAGLTGTSLPLFVAYADGRHALNNSPFGAGAVQFMVTEFGGAGIQSVIGNATTPIEVLPEPSTGLLLGAGLTVIGSFARRRRA